MDDDRRYYPVFGMLEDEMVFVSDADRRVVFVSPSVTSVLGYTVEEFRALSNPDLIHPDDMGLAVEQAIALRSEPGRSYRVTMRLLRADGSFTWADIVGRNLLDDPEIAGVVQAIRDVSDRVALEDELRHRAAHDALTGLVNKAELEARLAEVLDAAALAGPGRPTGIGVLFFDVDRFKLVNDSLGHHVGDDLLQAIAGAVRRVIEPEDVAARFGGDELVVVRAGVGWTELVDLAERLRTEVAASVGDGTGLPAVTLSIGAALGGPGDVAADLLRDADAALYEAKRAGRDRVRRFDPSLRARAVAAHEREQSARRGAPGAARPSAG